MQACLEDFDNAATRGLGRTLLANLARTRLLILDDWGLSTLQDLERHDLLEVEE